MTTNEKEVNSTPASNEVDQVDSTENEISQKVPQIRVLVKGVDRDPEIQTIPNTLKALQNLVGGYIEVVELDYGVCLICNEDGKCTGLPRNFDLPWDDYIVGTAVFVSLDPEGNFSSLDNDQVKHVKEFLEAAI